MNTRKRLNHLCLLIFSGSWLLSGCVSQKKLLYPNGMIQVREEILGMERHGHPLTFNEREDIIRRGATPLGANMIHDLLGKPGAGAEIMIGHYLLQHGKWCNGEGDALSARLVVLLWQQRYENALPFLEMAFLNDDVSCAEISAALLTQSFLSGTIPKELFDKSLQILFLAADYIDAPLSRVNPQLLFIGVAHHVLLSQKGAYHSALTPQIKQQLFEKLAELAKPGSSPTTRFSSMAVLTYHFRSVATELLPELLDDTRNCLLPMGLIPENPLGQSGSIRCAAIVLALQNDLSVPQPLINEYIKKLSQDLSLAPETNSEKITWEEAMELGGKRDFLSLLQKLLEKEEKPQE